MEHFTANLLIEKIHARENFFNHKAILLAIRPLMIGSKPCTDRFIQYQPPEGSVVAGCILML